VFTQLYTGTDTSFTHALLMAVTSYSYRVMATNLIGDSPFSNTAALLTADFEACPLNCSGRGACVQGKCQCTSQADGLAPGETYLGKGCEYVATGTQCFSARDMCLSFVIVQDDVHVRLRCPAGGWCGITIGAPDGMTQGDAWMVYHSSDTDAVGGGGGTTVNDMWSAELREVPTPDTMVGGQHLTDINGWTESDGQIVTFQRMVDTLDPRDVAFTDAPLRIGWAFAGDADFTVEHSVADRGVVDLNFVTGVATEVSAVDGVHRVVVAVVAGALMFCGFLLKGALRTTGVGRFLLQKRLAAPPSDWPVSDWITCNLRQSAAALTFGELGVLLAIAGGLTLYVVTWTSSNEKAGRLPVFLYGHLSQLFLGTTLLPVTRNSIWPMIFGISFERAIKFHRWLARVTIGMALVHALTMLGEFGAVILDPTERMNLHPTNFGYGVAYGTFALALMLVIFVTSCNCVRRKRFEWFMFTHFVFVAVVACVQLHYTKSYIWLAAPVLLYALDKAVQVYRGHVQKASLRQALLYVSPTGMTRVTNLTVQKRLPAGYEAGSYVFVNVPSISKFQWHPFSVSSTTPCRASSRSAFWRRTATTRGRDS
jgi:DMSO/TMAO reductase YedYZ heme-binding membrane subunit